MVGAAKKEAQLKKTKEEKDGLAAENSELQQKVQRMGSMRKQVAAHSYQFVLEIILIQKCVMQN